MNYLNKSFSVPFQGKAYEAGWDRIWGKKKQEHDGEWGYCYQCDIPAFRCKHCEVSSCSGGGCDKCMQLHEHRMNQIELWRNGLPSEITSNIME